MQIVRDDGPHDDTYERELRDHSNTMNESVLFILVYLAAAKLTAADPARGLAASEVRMSADDTIQVRRYFVIVDSTGHVVLGMPVADVRKNVSDIDS